MIPNRRYSTAHHSVARLQQSLAAGSERNYNRYQVMRVNAITSANEFFMKLQRERIASYNAALQSSRLHSQPVMLEFQAAAELNQEISEPSSPERTAGKDFSIQHILETYGPKAFRVNPLTIPVPEPRRERLPFPFQVELPSEVS